MDPIKPPSSPTEICEALRAKYPSVEFTLGDLGEIFIIDDAMQIHDPMMSSCGRFDGPEDHYGISEVDALLLQRYNHKYFMEYDQ